MDPIDPPDEPVVLRTLQPKQRTAWTTTVDVGGELLLAAIILRPWRDVSRRRVVVYAASVAARLLMTGTARRALTRSAPYPGRYDLRTDVEIPPSLIDDIGDVDSEAGARRAYTLLRAELGLSAADALLALSTIGEIRRRRQRGVGDP